jgi:tripartite-type tricarboxylate transporter receptor subunit TctC
MRRRSLLASLGALPAVARAQPAWPVRPVRLIVPFTPGGNTDVVARVLGARLSAAWGQTVMVENRPGAAANIGAEAAARSAPDGYTLFLGTGGTHGINPNIFPNLPFDPVRDFTPVVALVESPIYLVVSARLPARTLAEFIDYARAHPDALSYGSVGIGSPHHLAAEMLKQRTGIRMEHVPYRGSAQVVTDLLQGTIQVAWDVTAIAHTRDGRLRALAVGGSRRNPSWPEVPAMSELGFPDFEVGGWFALFGPAGLPAHVVERVNRDTNAAMRDSELLARYGEVGLRILGGTPEELAQRVRDELRRWGEVARAANIRLDL